MDGEKPRPAVLAGRGFLSHTFFQNRHSKRFDAAGAGRTVELPHGNSNAAPSDAGDFHLLGPARKSDRQVGPAAEDRAGCSRDPATSLACAPRQFIAPPGPLRQAKTLTRRNRSSDQPQPSSARSHRCDIRCAGDGRHITTVVNQKLSAPSRSYCLSRLSDRTYGLTWFIGPLRFSCPDALHRLLGGKKKEPITAAFVATPAAAR